MEEEGRRKGTGESERHETDQAIHWYMGQVQLLFIWFQNPCDQGVYLIVKRVVLLSLSTEEQSCNSLR